MKLLNRYVLGQIAVPSLLALVVISFIAVANEIRERVDELGSVELAQAGLTDLARVTVYFLPTLVSYVVPITFLMGILLAFGRLAQQGETIAMQAAGVSMKRVVLPVIAAGAVLSAVCFLLQDRVQPWAVTRLNRLIYEQLPLRATLDVLPPGVMHVYRDWHIYIGHKDPHTGTLYDLDILMPDGVGGTSVVHAESAQIRRGGDGQMAIVMRNGHIVPLRRERMERFSFAERTLVLPRLEPKSAGSRRRVLSLAELYALEQEYTRAYAETGSEDVKVELRRTRYEMSERILFPLGCLAVGLLAAPVGARARLSGRSYTFAAGFTIVLVYYVLWTLVEPRSLYPLPYVLIRGQVPNLVLILSGLGFLWRVDRV